jgi:hypothetical protein
MPLVSQSPDKVVSVQLMLLGELIEDYPAQLLVVWVELVTLLVLFFF